MSPAGRRRVTDAPRLLWHACDTTTTPLCRRTSRLGHVLWQLSQQVLGQVHRAAPRSHLPPLLGCALVLSVLGAVVSRRLSTSRHAVVLGAMCGSALAVAVSLTLLRGGRHTSSLAGLRSCAVTDPTVLSADGLANLVLFAPAAFFGVLAIGRPLRVVAGLAAVSLAVEAMQAVWSVGVCDSSDALLNTLGGLAAASLVRGLRAPRRLSPHGSVPGSEPCPESC